MVIAHVVDSLEIGGAEAVVSALCRQQLAAGHSPEVHCLMTEGALAAPLRDAGVPVHVHGPGNALTVMRRLLREFRRTRPDAVHCHNKAATVRAAPVARLAGARAVIATRHGMAAPPYTLRSDLKFWLATLVFRSRVVAVCDAARTNMRAGAGAAARDVVTIRNGAAAPVVQRPPSGRRDVFRLISVGRLVPAKDYATLLRSVAQVRHRVPDLQLWIAGDGVEAVQLRALIAELDLDGVVELLGARLDIGDLLHDSDVFVLSSASEGLPISLLEAMAAGLPAIVTNVGGMPEVLALSNAGCTVPAGAVDRLAEAIERLAADRRSLRELGARARRCYMEHFTTERMADQYFRLYQAGAHGSTMERA